MEKLIIEGTSRTPTIVADINGNISLKGISVPEDGMKFFLPLKEWIDAYALNPSENTVIRVELDYFNTSTAKILLTLFKLFERLSIVGHEVKIIWSYEENDFEIEEAGNDYKNLVDIPFEFVALIDK